MGEYHKLWGSALNVCGKPPKKGMNQANVQYLSVAPCLYRIPCFVQFQEVICDLKDFLQGERTDEAPEGCEETWARMQKEYEEEQKLEKIELRSSSL